LIGGVMGLAFPVCECGVVPVVRRLYEKGLPLSIGIAFLLAAPVVNPVVILSTYSAFGWGPIFARAHRLQLLDRRHRRADLQPRQAGGSAAAGVCQAHHDACCHVNDPIITNTRRRRWAPLAQAFTWPATTSSTWRAT
jgi:hypothetical protein